MVFCEDLEIRIEYNDSLPSYPSMTKRARTGFIFCNLLESALERDFIERFGRRSIQQIILTSSIYETKFDEYPPLIVDSGWTAP
jgi:hypothetical protein